MSASLTDFFKLQNSKNNRRLANKREALKNRSTIIDTKLNAIILDLLKPLGFPIVSEEDIDEPFDKYLERFYFLIDPLDGTVNFSKGGSFFSVAIAFCHGTSVIWSYIFLPDNSIYRSSLSKEKSFSHFELNQEVPFVDSKNLVVSTGVPSGKENRGLFTESVFSSVLDNAGKIRMYGCASRSILRVIDGFEDLYCEDGIFWWDVAAALLLAKLKGFFIYTNFYLSKSVSNISDMKKTFQLSCMVCPPTFVDRKDIT